MLKDLQKVDSEADWNDLQYYMLEKKEENVVIIAQTGLGKTEAGFLWGGNNKIFFTLPLRAAINSIYERLKNKIIQGEKMEQRVGLLHSETFQEYLKNQDSEKVDVMDSTSILEYETKTRQLSLPITICTLDQLFDIVYRYPGYEYKMATLSYSKVIIDEIQMYSSKLLAYLLFGLKLIQEYDGKFAILTATLPPYILDLMKNELELYFNSEVPEFYDEKLMCRHFVKVIPEEINIDAIREKGKGKKILVICNTIKKAKEMYQKLDFEFDNVKLFHSQFIKKDRSKKEKEIMA